MQGRQACCSFQQTCIEFVGDSFLGHGDTSEHKPVLMELIADECFTGYMRRGQGSIKHFCCACVCVCVCVYGLDWRVCEEMVHVSCAHPNSCSGDRSVCSVSHEEMGTSILLGVWGGGQTCDKLVSRFVWKAGCTWSSCLMT